MGSFSAPLSSASRPDSDQVASMASLGNTIPGSACSEREVTTKSRRQLAACKTLGTRQNRRCTAAHSLKLRSVSLSEPFRTAATRASSPDPCELPAHSSTLLGSAQRCCGALYAIDAKRSGTSRLRKGRHRRAWANDAPPEPPPRHDDPRRDAALVVDRAGADRIDGARRHSRPGRQ